MTQTAATDATSVTVEGVELSVPIEVQAATSIVAGYRVDPEVAQRIIDESGFEVRVDDDGRTGLAIVGVSYLQGDLQRYVEVGVVFDVEPDGDDESPTFIRWLPVTGAFTCAAGKDIWGFPKWVTDLRYTILGESARVEWYEEGELVLALQVAEGGDELGDADMPVVTYSVGPDGPQRTQTEMRNRGVVLGAAADLEVGPSTHPAAQALRDLGVANLQPALTTKISHSASSWSLAEPL